MIANELKLAWFFSHSHRPTNRSTFKSKYSPAHSINVLLFFFLINNHIWCCSINQNRLHILVHTHIQFDFFSAAFPIPTRHVILLQIADVLPLSFLLHNSIWNGYVKNMNKKILMAGDKSKNSIKPWNHCHIKNTYYRMRLCVCVCFVKHGHKRKNAKSNPNMEWYSPTSCQNQKLKMHYYYFHIKISYTICMCVCVALRLLSSSSKPINRQIYIFLFVIR